VTTELTTEPTIERERQLVQSLLELVDERERREHEIESRHAGEISDEQQQYQQVFQLLTDTYDAESTAIEQHHVAERATLEQHWETEAADVQSQFERRISEIESRWNDESSAARKERDEAGWLLSSLLDGDTEDSPLAKLQALQTGLVASRTELETALTLLDGWYRHSTDFLQRCRLLGEASPPEPSTLPVDLPSLHQKCIDSMQQAEPLHRRLMRRILPLAFRGVLPLVVFLAISGALFAAIWLFVPPSLVGLKLSSTTRDWQLISAGVGAAVGLVTLFMLHLIAGHRTLPDYEKIMQMAVDADAAFQRWNVASQRELERQEKELERLHEVRLKKRDTAVAHADNKLQARLDEAQALYQADLRDANAHFPAQLDEIERTKTHDLQQVEARYEAARQDHLLRRESDFRNLQATYDQRVGESRRIYQQSWQELIRDWHGGLRATGASADALCDTMRRICPDWPHVFDSADGDSTHAGELLTLGRIVADLASVEFGLSTDPRLKTERTQFELPLLVSLTEKPSLVVRSRGASRDAATRVLQTAMLRYLTAIPPGKVRFTILDPVGLGANFASFMHLADIDEQLVTSRIWTEPSHIEKRLADLTEHMETVLQAYLRNEYATLDDYNREAGEVAEPYRILVVANFPTNFTEVALRRLVSIAEGGLKCGVFVLISVDEAGEFPRGFSLADIERHATVLRLASSVTSNAQPALSELINETSEPGAVRSRGSIEDSGALRHPAHRKIETPTTPHSPFRLADPVLGNWPLKLDQPPPADEFGEIVRRAGQLAKDVRRVEVPFERVMPAAEAYWTFSTRAGLDVPIGRAGATKLQSLKLGKGTSQHVLVAGKTGSGKSTMLHALITNAALHYSPDEIEFYLIDFKKGVEFKTYATNRLPHARVIAIESDREFGVSVLQRLDTVLKDRGDLFRQVGVQDLAGYRDAVAASLSGGRHASGSSFENLPRVMPRILLIIDEFQEFFVEDDAISQSAALLFDRLIRQGRAFGVHVILGSQTLAGAYSLARSTLGQIAVRIALQCSDTDAHLILSEENMAARLLSRPGEAIYNDANGLIEGNHPFQIVWLEDAQRETYLEWMQQWAEEYESRESSAEGRVPESDPLARQASRWPDPVVFEGNIPADPTANSQWLEAVYAVSGSANDAAFLTGTQRSALSTQPLRNQYSCWLGEAVAMTGPAELMFGPRDGGPLLVIGRDDDAALGVLASLVLALAGQHTAPARFVILDGSLPDSLANRTWKFLANYLPSGGLDSPGKLTNSDDPFESTNDRPSPTEPGDSRPPVGLARVQVVSPRDAASALQSVVDEMKSRTSDLGPPVFVIAFDLARFRDLKKAEDDYGGFGGFDKEKTVSPSALFAEIVKDGPAAGVFPLVWCDGYQTTQRWLGRDLMSRFETRVLFAMNANDSSNLIDSPAAGRLGPNRALLFRADLGTLEKFRPYKLPDFDWLTQLRAGSSTPSPVAEDETAAEDEPAAEHESPAEEETAFEPPHNNGESSPANDERADVQDTDTTEAWTSIDDLNIL
jgi:DNA segregation ATPase FtsK/SpoIIIE, S-DNA-T family